MASLRLGPVLGSTALDADSRAAGPRPCGAVCRPPPRAWTSSTAHLPLPPHALTLPLPTGPRTSRSPTLLPLTCPAPRPGCWQRVRAAPIAASAVSSSARWAMCAHGGLGVGLSLSSELQCPAEVQSESMQARRRACRCGHLVGREQVLPGSGGKRFRMGATRRQTAPSLVPAQATVRPWRRDGASSSPHPECMLPPLPAQGFTGGSLG